MGRMLGSMLGMLAQSPFGMLEMPDNPAGARIPSRRGGNGSGVPRRVLGSVLGRFQGPEPFYIQTHDGTVQSPIIPRNLNLTRPLESIHIVWRGRVVIGTANYTAVAAEAPQSIIQRIRLTGTHRLWNQIAPIDISGATAFAWLRCFQTHGNELMIGTTIQPELTRPLAMLGATFGNTGTYDLEIHYEIPLGPMFPPNGRLSTIPYLYMPQDWADTLQLQLFLGDQSSFGTKAGGTTITYTAFGLGTGSPSIYIMPNYCILGPMADKIDGAVVIRNEMNISGGPVAAVANGQRLTLLQKQKTLNVMVKSGVLLTGSSAGISVYASLSDTMLDRTQIVLDNKPVRNNQGNFVAKQYAGRMFNTILPQGYVNFTFIDSQNPLTAYRGDQVPGGSTFELDSDVLTATANQAVSIVQEMVYGVGRASV